MFTRINSGDYTVTDDNGVQYIVCSMTEHKAHKHDWIWAAATGVGFGLLSAAIALANLL